VLLTPSRSLSILYFTDPFRFHSAMASPASEQTSAIGNTQNLTGSNNSRGLWLTICSAGLFALCPPGRPFPWLAWIAMVPLFFELSQTKPLRGFLFGTIFGWLMWFTSVWWLHAPLHDIAGLSRAGSILFIAMGCVLMGVPYGLASAIICKWRAKSGIFGAGRDAAIFTVAITFLTPVFPGSMAHTQYQYPVVLQILELGGTPLLLFLMFGVNRLIADAFLPSDQANNRWKRFGGAIAIVAVIVGYGTIRLQQFEAEAASAPTQQRIKIAAIQPNIPIPVAPDRQPDPDALTNDFFTAIEQARELAAKETDVDLFAFPENPATFLFNSDTARRDAIGKLIQQTGKPVVLNADAIDSVKSTNEVPERYNLALLLDSQRNLAGHYAKIKRVPAVEFIPGEKMFPWLRTWLPKSQRVLAGNEITVFKLNENVRLIPLICYEGTISSLTRQFVQKGGNVILNLVNDSWFLRTPASEIHLALTLFRAVEYRVPLVRVTNSGTGAHIQADGRIVAGSKTEIFTRAERAHSLHIPAKRSFYAQIGNWWMLAFVGFLVPCLGLRRISKN
jgi:apolipoprotein N-acyltransferase